MNKTIDNFVSHDIHIPVLGIGFSIDTPLKVAKFGIDSVIALAGDNTIEYMRKFYSNKKDIPYKEIKRGKGDYRAKRITKYLNILNDIVNSDFNKIREMDFNDKDNDLNRTFQLLPPSHPVRIKYEDFMKTPSNKELKIELKSSLRKGSIDVNIMTKLNAPHPNKKGEEYKEAMAALRGYANSDLESSVVFSAGIDKQLSTYMTQFPDFFPDKDGKTRKKVILKVTDFRSMKLQAMTLAKMGIWVSEYRIESGLNCGGHAFGNGKGNLAGPILSEIRNNKEDFYSNILKIYNDAVTQNGITVKDHPSMSRITYQGGVKSNRDVIWLKNMGMDGVGVGTPFLFVPEVTNVSRDTLKTLKDAQGENIVLSSCSPLGVPFWLLNNKTIGIQYEKNIKKSLGVKCTYAHLRSPYKNPESEYNETLICGADSRRIYDEVKRIDSLDKSPEEKSYLFSKATAPVCLCKGLEMGVVKNLELGGKSYKKITKEIICPGPSAESFHKEYSLKEMIQHLNGEISLLIHPGNLAMDELKINLENIYNVLKDNRIVNGPKVPRQLMNRLNGIENTIEFYKNNISTFIEEKNDTITILIDKYASDLAKIKEEYIQV